MAARTLYDIVGVPEDVPRDIIGSACKRKLAKLAQEPSEEARNESVAVRDAWAILGDENQRGAYDARLRLQREAPGMVNLKPPEPETGPGLHVVVASAERWKRHRLIAGAVMGLVFAGFMVAYNVARQKAMAERVERVQRASEEAEQGEPPPSAIPRPSVAEKPFSAEEFEREMKEREREVMANEEASHQAQEDEFRKKNPGSSTRSYRIRRR